MISKIDSSHAEKAVCQVYADKRHYIIQNIKDRPSDPSKPCGNSQKQGVRRKTTNKEELIKYMPNLPGYLQHVEKGENLQEKALNFGVLDWIHLEKWKYIKKYVPGRSSMYSESTSDMLSLFSTVGSTPRSSKSNNDSPSHQRKLPPSLHSYSSSSLKEHHSHFVKHFTVDSALDVPNVKSLPKNTFVEGEAHSYCKNHSGIKLEQGKREDLNSKIATKMGTRKSFSESYSEEEDHFAEIFSDVPHSCPQPCIVEVESSKQSSMKLPSSVDDPNNYSAKSVPVISESSAFSEYPNRDQENSTSRSRSSPLRRLLDPLLKPMAAIRTRSPKSIHEEPTSTPKACKSANGRINSSTIQLVNRNLDFSSSGPSKVSERCVHALLQVTEKELPWFTFAVENESDVLAASMRKITPGEKDDGSCFYTFYSVHEIKKKTGGWINQRGKGKSRAYLSNLSGQMKVSKSHIDSNDLFMVKEFILYGVELRQADQGVIDFKSSSEVAAIVVKFPKGALYGENLQNKATVRNESLSSVTVILPSAVHGLPSKGVPSPLIHRWKSGGLCDCGGWDIGCKLRVLGDLDQHGQKLGSSEACLTPNRFNLFVQGGGQERRPIFSFAPFKKGIYSVVFSSSISTLQAFSICIAVLNSKKETHFSEMSKFCDTKTLEGLLVENDGIKASTGVKKEVPSSYVSYPPLSPVERV